VYARYATSIACFLAAFVSSARFTFSSVTWSKLDETMQTACQQKAKITADTVVLASYAAMLCRVHAPLVSAALCVARACAGRCSPCGHRGGALRSAHPPLGLAARCGGIMQLPRRATRAILSSCCGQEPCVSMVNQHLAPRLQPHLSATVDQPVRDPNSFCCGRAIVRNSTVHAMMCIT